MNDKPQFEIHLGFPHKAIPLCRQLLSEQKSRGWKSKEATEVVTGPAARGMIDPHDVPGILSMLVTRKLENLKKALEDVDLLAGRLVYEPDVRIELEQVLLTQFPVVDNREDPVAPFLPYTPDQDQFNHGTLISDTPPFEAHFGIRNQDDTTDLSHKTSDLISLAEDAGVPIHQAVRFKRSKDGSRVIFTTFFTSYEEMVARIHPLAHQLRDAMHKLDRNLILKLVAERILFCMQPGTRQLGSEDLLQLP